MILRIDFVMLISIFLQVWMLLAGQKPKQMATFISQPMAKITSIVLLPKFSHKIGEPQLAKPCVNTKILRVSKNDWVQSILLIFVHPASTNPKFIYFFVNKQTSFTSYFRILAFGSNLVYVTTSPLRIL